MSDVAQDKILLEIVTPKGRALSEVVDEVTAPAQDGEFGVLPGHLPLLASLRTGIVSYRKGGAAEFQLCAVGSGFVEAGPNKVLILTDEYIVRSGVDPVVVRTELAAVQAQIVKAEQSAGEANEVELASKLKALIARENWLAAQLELYGDPPPATMRPYEEYGPPTPIADEPSDGQRKDESPSADA